MQLQPSRLEAFQAALALEGREAALATLNAGVPHRYTGLYQLRAALLANIALVDKQGEITPQDLLEVPLHDSFCQFVLRDGSFRTTDTASDGRLDGHKYKGVILSYTGVPVTDAHGQLWGTLCHFDTASWHLTDAEFALLQRVARLLSPHIP